MRAICSAVMPAIRFGCSDLTKVGLPGGGEQRFRIAGRVVARRAHQLRRLDLAHRLHLAQHLERVLELTDLSFSNSMTSGQMPTSSVRRRLMRLDVEVEGLGEFVLRDAAFDCSHDHEVLLNRGEPIDPLVVRVGLVVGRDEALDLGCRDVDRAPRAACDRRAAGIVPF